MFFRIIIHLFGDRSYWQAGKWGYKCCHSFIKNSYCTGEAGIRASETTVAGSKQSLSNEEQNFDNEKQDSGDEKSSTSDTSSNEEEKKSKIIKKSKSSKKKDKKRKQKEKRKNKEKLAKIQEQDKLQQALQREIGRLLQLDERKRPYNSMYEVQEPSAEEIEAFQMKRKREDDPMAEFLNK